MLEPGKIDRAFDVVGPVRRRQRPAVQIRKPRGVCLTGSDNIGAVVQRKHERLISVERGGAADLAIPRGAKEHEHRVLVACEGQRRCRQVGNIVNVFAEDVDASGCAHHSDRPVAVELAKSLAQCGQTGFQIASDHNPSLTRPRKQVWILSESTWLASKSIRNIILPAS